MRGRGNERIRARERAKEPYIRDDIMQKRPIILRSLLIVATPYTEEGMREYELASELFLFCIISSLL